MPTQKGNPLVIDLGGQKVVKKLGDLEIKSDKIKIRQFIDSPVDKTVVALTMGAPSKILLWEGADYDAIGQWTETDVANRVIALFA